MKHITDQQWWKMCSAQLSMPIPLGEADLNKPFIYDREYGFMYCPFGYHQTAMALLLAFAHGCKDGIEVCEKLGLEYPIEAADMWLETRPGATYKSSQSSKIRAGHKGCLNIIEKKFFRDVEYQFTDQN